MGWTLQQIRRIHSLKTAAGLTDPEYRNLLRICCRTMETSKDPRLDDGDFSRAIERLQRELDYRVAEGIVPPPKWRKAPAKLATQAQIRMCFGLIHELNSITGEKYDRSYILGVASRCAGREIRNIDRMLRPTAKMTIDALKDAVERARSRQESLSHSHAHARDTNNNQEVMTEQELGYPPEWDL